MKNNHNPDIKTEQNAEEVFDISVAEWHELSLGGADIPVVLRLNGGSMRPLIRKQKDAVTVVPVNRPLRTGDVVLFSRSDGAYVVHRIRSIRGETVLTVGDNCVDFDAPMPASQVWGIAVSLERNGKKICLDSAFSRACGRLRMATIPARRLFKKLLRFGARIKRKLVGRNGQN